MRITNEKNDIRNPLFTELQLKRRVEQLGEQLTADYAGKEPIVACVLKGSSMFYADLCRAMKCHMFMDFIAASSYGAESKSSGIVKIVKDLDTDVFNRHVLIVEDIIDSGRTLSHLAEYLKLKGVRSVRTCTLLDKPERREVSFTPDYVGFTIPDEFVVGYGLDYNEAYRELPFVGVLRPSVYAKELVEERDEK